jgi:hypothetical protein
MSEALAKVQAAEQDVDRYIFENHVRPRITPEVIAEHEANTIGSGHSPDLEVVLRYLRRIPTKTIPRYVIVETKPNVEFTIAQHGRVRAEPLTYTEETFASIPDAQHAIFLRRLRDLGDEAVDRALERAGH